MRLTICCLRQGRQGIFRVARYFGVPLHVVRAVAEDAAGGPSGWAAVRQNPLQAPSEHSIEETTVVTIVIAADHKVPTAVDPAA